MSTQTSALPPSLEGSTDGGRLDIESLQEPVPDFDSACTAASTAIFEALSRAWWTKPHDPEVRANLSRLSIAINEIHRTVTLTPATESTPAEEDRRIAMREYAADRIRQILLKPGGGLRRLDVAAARQLVRDFDDLLIERGDEAYVFALAKEEYLRSDSETAPAVSWIDAYEKDCLTGLDAFLEGRPISSEQETAARHHLLTLHRAQWNIYNQKRGRAELKAHFLAQLTGVMTLILIVFAAAIGLSGSGSTWLHVLLAVSAGAVGASLSAAFKMRDTVQTSLQARAFAPIALMQPVVGAIAGLVMLLVLESGLLQINTSVEWAAWGAMAFLAGFSEPFFLNVVGRLAQAEVDTPTSATSAAK